MPAIHVTAAAAAKTKRSRGVARPEIQRCYYSTYRRTVAQWRTRKHGYDWAAEEGLEEGGSYLKMFTARAVTSRMLIADTPDSDSINNFAQRLSGIASVGLNAMEFVNEM